MTIDGRMLASDCLEALPPVWREYFSKRSISSVKTSKLTLELISVLCLSSVS